MKILCDEVKYNCIDLKVKHFCIFRFHIFRAVLIVNV